MRCTWRCGFNCTRRRHRGRNSRWPHPRSFRRSFFRFLFRFSGGLRRSFRLCLSQNILADLFGDILRDRARVRLLFRDAIPRQKVNDRFGLDLEFPG